MLRFIRSSLSTILDEESQISDYVSYKKIDTIGCPTQTAAIGFDDLLGLLFLATSEGRIFVLGGEKVSWTCMLTELNDVFPYRIYIAKGFGMAIIAASSRKELRLFRIAIRGSTIKVHEIQRDPRWKLSNAFSIVVTADNQALFLQGTQGGNIAKIHMDTLMCDEFLRSDQLPKKQTLRAAPIHHMVASPDYSMLAVIQVKCSNKNHQPDAEEDHEESYVVLTIIDLKTQEMIRESHLDSDSKIKAITWTLNDIICIHLENGTCVDFYLTRDPVLNMPQAMFGAFPSKGMKQIEYCHCERSGDEKLLIFIGGVLDTVFGDRHILTLRSERKTLCLEFECPVLSFDVVREYKTEDNTFYASVLIILTKHEIVCIDLKNEEWRELPPRYLYPMDAHDVTSTQCISDVTYSIHKQLNEMSDEHWDDSRFSTRPHPFFAYYFDDTSKIMECNLYGEHARRQLLLVGFSDGTINLVNTGEKSGKLLFRIDTKKEYSTFRDDYDENSEHNQHETEEPPFRKVGAYDPYSDDPGMEVIALTMDNHTGLIAAGTKSGVVLVYQLGTSKMRLTPDCLTITLGDTQIMSHSKVKKISKNMNTPRRTSVEYDVGFQPYTISEDRSIFIQVEPHTPVFALSILAGRHLIAIGTEFGFSVVHLKTNTVIYNHSFITMSDLNNVVLSDNTWSVFKSMKKSLRDTFRRRKRAREEEHSQSFLNDKPQLSDPEIEDMDDLKPIERRIEGRTHKKDEYKPWLVRLAKFVCLPWTSGSNSDILWIGTNGGNLLCLSVLETDSKISLLKEKEILLSHGAPVLDVEHFLDHSSKGGAVSRLLVVTQEQVRLFLVPTLKSTGFKMKVTRREGIKIKRSKLVQLINDKKDKKQNFLMLLTNTGEIRIQSLTNPHKSTRLPLTLKNNQLAMEHAILTHQGEFIYLRAGQSEFQRLTSSASTLPWTEAFEGTLWPYPYMNQQQLIEKIIAERCKEDDGMLK